MQARGLLDSLSRWPATAAVAAAIWSLSEVPASDLPGTRIPGADKAVHLVEYCVLGALLLRSVRGERRSESSGHFAASAIIAVCVGALFGALDEWHQAFTDRTPDVWDLAADVAGLALAVGLLAALRRRRRVDGG